MVSRGKSAFPCRADLRRHAGHDADVYCISQMSRTGDGEQTPAVRAGLPESELYAETH